jgi:hypothetical protein
MSIPVASIYLIVFIIIDIELKQSRGLSNTIDKLVFWKEIKNSFLLLNYNIYH